MAQEVRLEPVPGPDGVGLRVGAALQPRPLAAEWVADGTVRLRAAGYRTLEREEPGWVGRGVLPLAPGAVLDVVDRWTVDGPVARLRRSVVVRGSARGGFLTAVTLPLAHAWADLEPFAPGLLYGRDAPLAEGAIGRTATLRVREDRLPAPLFAVGLPDGTALAVLHTQPDGATTRADSEDRWCQPLVDERFAFAAVGAQPHPDGVEVGLWFPGTEGDTTYAVQTPFSAGQFEVGGQRRWRHRHHPLRDGVEQHYGVALRWSRERPRELWRWAWDELAPAVQEVDLPAVREDVLSVLAGSVATVRDRAGPAHARSPLDGRVLDSDVLLGFTARAADTADLLLAEPRHAGLGVRIVESLVRLPVSPPRAEGFRLRSGTLTSGPREEFALRSLCEGGQGVLRAWRREHEAGREHDGWLRWCEALGGWLCGQAQQGGGLPRSWRDGTAEVTDPDPRAGYVAAPFLGALYETTGEQRLLDVALAAAEVAWEGGGARSQFTGGTLDHSGALDKEAATLSLEAHLVLHGLTGEPRWLERAVAAADVAETWIYLWDVPMPVDADPERLHWRTGASTVGCQLIGTGHSLVDMYMAVDVASFARLAQLTGDAHYRDVAHLLLHGTKTMVAAPGRTQGLVGPGWQQEHWSLAPPRGMSRERAWLPWVATSQLRGLAELERVAPDLLGRPLRP